MAGFREKIEKNAYSWLMWGFLVALALSFFAACASYILATQSIQGLNGSTQDYIKWTAPDEAANYVFAKLYAQEGQLSFCEKYNLYVEDIMRPRSYRSDHCEIKPMSFLGMTLLYGRLADWTDYRVLSFLTPFFGAIGIIVFFLLVRRLFDQRVALISAVFLTFSPAYVHYSAHSMFHNVLFVVCLLLGLYLSVLAQGFRSGERYSFLARRGDWLYLVFSFLSGIVLAWAAAVRASELLWLAPALFVLWMFNMRRLGLLYVPMIISGLMMGILPILYHNESLYGNMFYGGYAEMNASISSIGSASTQIAKATVSRDVSAFNAYVEQIFGNIFHFGLHPRQSYLSFQRYFVDMFPFLFWMSLAGLLLYLFDWRHWRKASWAYILSGLFASVFLVLYYGSWQFHDNPNVNSFTIGNSYVRYWLPIYLFAMTWAAYFLAKSSAALGRLAGPIESTFSFANLRPSRRLLSLLATILVLVPYCISSVNFVYSGSEESLLAGVTHARNSRFVYDRVIERTPHNSVIITRYHDKLLFPERKVIVGLFDDDNMIRQYAKLADLLPLYYFNFSLPDKDLKYLAERRLPTFGLTIERVAQIDASFSLYKITSKK